MFKFMEIILFFSNDEEKCRIEIYRIFKYLITILEKSFQKVYKEVY